MLSQNALEHMNLCTKKLKYAQISTAHVYMVMGEVSQSQANLRGYAVNSILSFPHPFETWQL